jgi:hypothetical protein
MAFKPAQTTISNLFAFLFCLDALHVVPVDDYAMKTHKAYYN